MIFLICGTFGSGKTTLVRRFLIEHDHQAVGFDARGTAEVFHIPEFNTFVLGPYTMKTGGCDSIKPFDRIEPMVREYAERGNVLFEGMIVGAIWGRWHNLSQELGPGQFTWVFLDTPKEVCLSRVYIRNNGRTINPNNIFDKFERVRSILNKALQAGEIVRILNHERAYRQLLDVFALEGIALPKVYG